MKNSTASARPRPRLYAHRGAAAEQPENTLPSFRRALELGADALEMDVHMTADGAIVVSHDANTARMAGVALELRRAELAEVKRLDVGYGFVDGAGARPFLGKGYRIPTFEEVLAEFPDVVINVDLKQSRPSIVAPLLALLRRAGAEERAQLASYSLATLLEVRARGYRGTTALSRTEVFGLLLLPRQLITRLPLVGSAAQLPPRAGPLNLSRPELIAKCHELGMRVDFWTVNDPEQARRLLESGADGIMSDDPAAIVPLFDDWVRGTPA